MRGKKLTDMQTRRKTSFFNGTGGYLIVAGVVAALLVAVEFALTGGEPAPAPAPVPVPATPPEKPPAPQIEALRSLESLGTLKSLTNATTAVSSNASPASPASSPKPVFRFVAMPDSGTRWVSIPKLKVNYIPVDFSHDRTPLGWDVGEINSGNPLPAFDADLVFAQLPPPSHESPFVDWNFSSDSLLLRDPTQATRTTITPVVLSLLHPFHFSNWETFRPVVSVGAGFLRQTVESGGEVQAEMLPVLRAGIGAEWEPAKQVFFRINYEYSHLPVESALNPDLPGRDHAIQTGVEIKF
jgi:hypothetical protein